MPRTIKLCARCSAGIRFDRFTSPAFAFLGSLDIFIQPTKQILFPLWWDVKVRHGRLKWVHICTVGLWTQMGLAESGKKEKRNETSRSMCGEGRTHHILLFETRTHACTQCTIKCERISGHSLFVCFISRYVDWFGSVSAPPSSSTHSRNNQLFIQRQNKWLRGNSPLFIVFTACCMTPVKGDWILGENTLAANLRLWQLSDAAHCAK